MTLKKACNSTIVLKLTMALSGLIMVGFLVAHLSGNLLVFAGPHALNTYAEKLRDFLPVLWILRLGLIAAAILHIYSGVTLQRRNKASRPIAYQKKTYRVTTPAARSMFLSGLVLLSFIVYHLAHLTFRLTHSEFQNLGHYDVYQMLILSFQSPLLASFYSISILLLMAHLSHGVTSLFQTLGIKHPLTDGIVTKLGPLLAVVLGCGFLSIPVSILFGFVR